MTISPQTPLLVFFPLSRQAASITVRCLAICNPVIQPCSIRRPSLSFRRHAKLFVPGFWVLYSLFVSCGLRNQRAVFLFPATAVDVHGRSMGRMVSVFTSVASSRHTEETGNIRPFFTFTRCPSSALLSPFLGEGSPTDVDYRKKGTLILTSRLEDLV